MLLAELLTPNNSAPPVTVGILGSGNCGTAIITQSTAIRHYVVTFVADPNEVFDYTPDPRTIASRSIGYLDGILEAISIPEGHGTHAGISGKERA